MFWSFLNIPAVNVLCLICESPQPSNKRVRAEGVCSVLRVAITMGKNARTVSHVEDDHAADSNIEAAVNAMLAKKADVFERNCCRCKSRHFKRVCNRS